MSASKKSQQQTRGETHLAQETLTDVVKGQVVRALGEPGGNYLIRVRRLWEDHYRANIFLGEEGMSGRITHSYFLVADGDGNILEATPALTKRF